MNHLRRLVAFVLVAMCAAPGAAQPAPATGPAKIAQESTLRRPTVRAAIADGVAFLVKSQNADGSWGTGTVTCGNEVYTMIPGSHDALRIATTALCVMALRDAGESTAHARGVHYLMNCPEPRRDDGQLILNTWAHMYRLQALSEELLATKNDADVQRLRIATRQSVDGLEKHATYIGGWHYYDFRSHTSSPSMAPTSFGTAAGLVALHEAEQAGVAVPRRLVDLSIHRLEECRLPNGFFLYEHGHQNIPRLPANQPRGAIGRTQPSNYALWLWQSKKADDASIRAGLDAFFKDHACLEMGRKRPVPHESWYQTAGYYYYYDHYYASRLIAEAVPATNRPAYMKQMIECILPHQEADGSWWDFPMWDYHKPYGTAFAVMTLTRMKE